MTYAPVTVAARRMLLNALDALEPHRQSLVLVGAHAVYLYTGDTDVPIATFTKDSDLALIPRLLAPAPTLEASMSEGGFRHDRRLHQPGEWVPQHSADDPPVELLVPEKLRTPGGRRGARIPPHSPHAARSVLGLEAAAVSHRPATIASLEPDVDQRKCLLNVASPAALVVAKTYKIGERAAEDRSRLLDKDAHDLYRLLRAVALEDLVVDFHVLLSSDVADAVTRQALRWLRDLARTPEAELPMMAARTERLVGDPAAVARDTWALLQDMLDGITVPRG